MAAKIDIAAPLREPLERVLGWMVSHADAAGGLICPQHRIEHTGKSAGAIITACALARAGHPDPESLFRLALGQAERLTSRLEREGDSTCFTFRPGRHDPFNCSNNVIDGGACADALVDLVRVFGERMTAGERERHGGAAVLHAQTYLRYAVMDKGIPAQRAWAMTGVAAASRLAGHEVLGLTVREGARELAAVQHADGSYPYHPRERGPAHVGASDVSAYYQGRVSGFLLHSLQGIGEDPSAQPWSGPLRAGLDFLAALYGPDGIKCAAIEAKPWYWGAEYEVASHPFDVYALARGWRLFGDERFGRAALAAHRAWCRHLDSSGAPRDHLPGPGRELSYQCPMFFAAHAAWAARALPDLAALQALPGAEPGERAPELRAFEQASLFRLEDERVVAWVRGARPGSNGMHGSPRGGGLLRVWRREDAVDLLARTRPGEPAQGEWSGEYGRFGLRRGLRAGAADVRFSLWLARNRWRWGLRADALRTPWRQLRRSVLAFAATGVCSSFELSPRLSWDRSAVCMTGRLALRDGSPVEATELQRRFSVDGSGLLVQEQLVHSGEVRNLRYELPDAATAVEGPGSGREGTWCYRLA